MSIREAVSFAYTASGVTPYLLSHNYNDSHNNRNNQNKGTLLYIPHKKNNVSELVQFIYSIVSDSLQRTNILELHPKIQASDSDNRNSFCRAPYWQFFAEATPPAINPSRQHQPYHRTRQRRESRCAARVPCEIRNPRSQSVEMRIILCAACNKIEIFYHSQFQLVELFMFLERCKPLECVLHYCI
ncbi:hypothetical protein TNCV_1901181 [Trichonephila clavipes]|nr:hypothetical protein TNCV_1901181 [Trichonephila clavipes]